jgi:hypothetical protein
LPEAPDQARHVGALRAVVGVQLVEHQVPQRRPALSAHSGASFGPLQQQVEHAVVGEQDVRRLGAQPIVVVDHVVAAHLAVLCPAADEQPHAHPPTQALVAEDRVGEAPGLIGGERVHRVEHDRLDAALAGGARRGA